jgi:hypothetical protein
MLKRMGGVAVVVTLLILTSPAPAVEPKIRAAAQKILAKHQDALLVVKVTVNDRSQEGLQRQLEIPGTVVAPSGLTVVSNWFSLDRPTWDEEFDETKTTDVALVLKDGREVPAQFVLRDRDLDLAFVMPLEKKLQLPHVAMAKGPLPEVLDDLILLYRLGKALKREAAVSLAQVDAVLHKPRPLVVPNRAGIGLPAFDASGRIVGITVVRRLPRPRNSRNPLEETVVILTAGEIHQAMQQIPRGGGKP